MPHFNTPLEGAAFFLKTRRPVFPIVPGGKTPAIEKNEESSTTSAESIQKWDEKFKNRKWNKNHTPCNWGYFPSLGGETVIDLDTHNGKDGGYELKKLMDSLGQSLPDTFTVSTPSGGAHLYFRGVLPDSTDGFLPGVDVHSTGKYVIAPGSHTEENQKKHVAEGWYQIIDDRDPAELPAWFIDYYLSKTGQCGSRKKEKTELSANAAVNLRVTPDSESNILQAKAIILAWPETFEGGRNDALNNLMWRICRCGVTAGKAEELYYEYGVDRLHYGATEDERGEIHNTILSAYKDMTIFGADSPEVLFYAPVTSEDNKPYGFAELRAREVPPRKWLIRDWIYADPGSVFMLSGQGGTGKSLLALMLANSLATGEPWLGMEINHRAKSFFVTCEDSEDEVARRVQKVDQASHAKQKDDSLVKIWCRQGMNNIIATGGRGRPVGEGPFFNVLKQVCSNHFGRDGGLLILDTMADFIAIDENSRMEVSQFVKHILSKLGQELGICVLLLGHPNKTNTGYSGSSAWEGSVRGRWELEWKDQKVGEQLFLRLAKSNASMGGKTIALEYGPDFLPRVVPEGAKQDTFLKNYLYEKIRSYLEEGNPLLRSPQATNAIRKLHIIDPTTQLKVGPRQIDDAVSELIAEGRVREIPDNKKRILTIVEA